MRVQVELALWPNKDFLDKKSKFAMDVLPLEALLDYNEDDTKEGHFEVSMFAELFKEMLQTRFARGMLRALAVLDHEVRTPLQQSKSDDMRVLLLSRMKYFVPRFHL